MATVRTLQQLDRDGVSPDAAERRVRTGRWQRLAAGIYLCHDGPPTDAELADAAAAHVRRPFVVTGAVVLRQLGLRWVPPDTGIHVLTPYDVRTRSSGLVKVTRCQGFAELDTWRWRGVTCAAADRAVTDAGRAQRSLRDVRGLVLGAVADRWAAAEELVDIVDAGRRNGSALLRRAVRDAARGCASPPEAELVDEMVGRRVPFYVNPELWLDGVLLGIPDVWLVGRGIGGEVESQERHGSEPHVENTYDRHERFAMAGVDLVHLSVSRIRRDTAAAARHLLTRAARPEPSGLLVVPRGPLLS